MHRMHRAIFAAVVLTAAVATPLWSDVTAADRSTVASAAPSSPRVDKKSAERKYQKQAVRATNARRADHDRAALRQHDCVQRFAVRQAKAMAAKRSMYHQDLGPILEQCGLNAVGENVAYGYPSGRSVVNDGWMNSDGHRANILNGDFRLLGIGARRSADGTWYVAQVFGRKA